MRNKIPTFLLVLLFLLLGAWAIEFSVARAVPAMAVQAPVLKWQHGGCYSSWCETGWYASPAVADLDNDGNMEVIGATYSLFVLNGEDGSEQWTADPAGSRVWPGVVVADLTGDVDLEIVIAAGGGNVSVFDHLGNFEPGWPKTPGLNEFRSLAVDDLEGDGDLEIVVGQARLDKVNVWVLEHHGGTRPGWPQITSAEGSAAGLYNDNIGLGDLDGDGELEIVVPSDTITIAAYEPDGSSLPTDPMYHDHPGHDMDYWGEVPAYIDLVYETRGWGPCYDEFTPRANFADGPANIVDVNGDGVSEVVVIGDVAAAQRAFLREARWCQQFTGKLVRRADVHHGAGRISRIGQHVTAHCPQTRVWLARPIASRPNLWRCSGQPTTLVQPLLPPAIDKAYSLVTVHFQVPEGLCGKPVVVIPVIHNGCVAADAGPGHERLIGGLVGDVPHQLVLSVNLPVLADRAWQVAAGIRRCIHIHLHETETRIIMIVSPLLGRDQKFWECKTIGAHLESISFLML